MFPDSKIAKNYEMSSTKVMYLGRYGINPYFKADLAKEIELRSLIFHLIKQRPISRKNSMMVTPDSFHQNQ